MLKVKSLSAEVQAELRAPPVFEYTRLGWP